MKRFFVVLFVVVSILSLSNLLDHVPTGNVSVTYVPDLSKLYDAFKGTTLGNILMNMLGLEPMADNLITAQLQAYELDPEIFYSSLKEFMFVQKNLYFLSSFGPSSEADKLAEVVKELVSDEATQVEVFVEPVDGYVVISNSKDLIEDFKKGGGQVPEEVEKYLKESDTLGISFAVSREARGFGKLHLENGVLVSSGKTIFFDEELRKKIENMKPKKPFKKTDEISGDAFVLVNTNDAKEVVSYIENLGVNIDEDFKEFVEHIGNVALLCVDYTDSFVQEFMGSENPPEPKMKGFFEYLGDISDLTDDCSKIDGGYDCDDLKIRITGNIVEIYYPDFDVGLSGNAKDYFEKSYAGNEVIFAFADFSRIFEQIFGLSTSSYILLRVWVEDGNIIGRFEIK